MHFSIWGKLWGPPTLGCSQTGPLQPCGCGRPRLWTGRGRWSSAGPASTGTAPPRRCSALDGTEWNQLQQNPQHPPSQKPEPPRARRKFRMWLRTHDPLLHGVQGQVLAGHLRAHRGGGRASYVWCWRSRRMKGHLRCLTEPGSTWWRGQRWGTAAGHSSTGQQTGFSVDKPSVGWSGLPTETGHSKHAACVRIS